MSTEASRYYLGGPQPGTTVHKGDVLVITNRRRRPLCRVRYVPVIDMWVVSATEHAPDGFRNSTAWPSWPEAMSVAHRVVEMLLTVQRERDKRNSRRPGQWAKAAGYGKGGIVQPIPTGRTNFPPLEQHIRATNYQGGLISTPPWADNDQNRKK